MFRSLFGFYREKCFFFVGFVKNSAGGLESLFGVSLNELASI